MTARRGAMTLAEAMAELDADPAFQARRAAKDRDHAVLAEQRRREQAPLLADLARAGAP